MCYVTQEGGGFEICNKGLKTLKKLLRNLWMALKSASEADRSFFQKWQVTKLSLG